MTVTLPPDYRPSDDEPFMNENQREYFRQKLLRWRQELLRESDETLQHLQEGGMQEPDIADRAQAEADRALELRTRDRARKLIAKIDAALERIEDGSYGYCEETNEPISLRRLEARPSPRSASRPRNATSAWSAPTGRTESSKQRPEVKLRPSGEYQNGNRMSKICWP